MLIMRIVLPILATFFSLTLAIDALAIDALADSAQPPSNQDLGSSVLESSHVDHREVYIVTSRIEGKYPKIGPLRHASIAICPKGISPIVYENGVPVSNCRQCELYGTDILERGFKPEPKRINAKATKIRGVSASTVEQRMRSHCHLNVPAVNDCRHHVNQILGLRNRRGRVKRAFTVR